MKVVNRYNYFLKYLKTQLISLASVGSGHNHLISLRKKLSHKSREKNLSIINADFLSFKVESKLSNFNRINGDIVLFCQFFSSSQERDKDHISAIYKNINNEFIQNIVIYTDGSVSLEKIPDEIKSHNKTEIIPFDGKVSFYDFIDYFKNNFKKTDICLISNCDCYYDSSIKILNYLKFNNGNDLFCCTRKEKLLNNDISYAVDPLIHLSNRDSISFDLNNKRLDLSSSDCFIINGDFSLSDSDKNNFLGSINTEYNFLSNQFLQGKKIINLFCFLNCIHLHQIREPNKHSRSEMLINKIFPNPYNNKTTTENYIYGTWRLRCPENYIDKNYPIQDFGDFLPLNSSSLLELNSNISSNLTKQNTLCLFYLFTKKEYDDGLLQNSFRSFFNLLPSLSFKIKVFLFSDVKLNKGELIESLTPNCEYREFIDCIIYHSLDIPPEDNVYIKKINNNNNYKIPELGLSSGPNLMFFKALEFLRKTDFKNFILLEPDSTCLKSYWLDTLIDSCINRSFLIQGGNYSGLNQLNYNVYYSDHINGLAIYKNHNSLHALAHKSKELIIESIKSNFITTPNQEKHQINKHLSFDVALFLTFSKEKCLSKYLTSNLFSIKTDIEDYVLTKTEVLSENPEAIILHQKKPNPKFLV